ncbi:diguanylate cyclase [Zavarzinia sp.]|uniref:GGDEF domain-containing protein n=1 Tax=Zavarzinia sp. TaxID=2027920 RepID=UPI003BB6ADFB
MDSISIPNFFLLLLLPVIAALFGTIIVLAHVMTRTGRYTLLAPFAFYFFAAALTLQSFVWPPLTPGGTTIVAIFYVASVFATSELFLRFFGKRNDYRLALPAALAVVVAMHYFSAIAPDVVAQIYVLNFSCGLSLIATALRIGPARHEKPLIGQAIYWGLMAMGAHFIPRCLLAVYFDAQLPPPADFRETIYWASTNFFGILTFVALTTMVLCCMASDVVDATRNDGLHDPLSGLLNRRGFEHHAQPAHQAPCGVIFCDLDHFKDINDTLGHGVGDNVLREVGQLIRRHLTAGAIAARVGGEEFIILRPRRAQDDNFRFAEALRREIEDCAFSGVPPDMTITASFGVVTGLEGESLDNLMRSADAMLYAAKSSGRNRSVTTYPHI